MFSVDDEAVVDRSSFSSHGILFNARRAATEKALSQMLRINKVRYMMLSSFFHCWFVDNLTSV